MKGNEMRNQGMKWNEKIGKEKEWNVMQCKKKRKLWNYVKTMKWNGMKCSEMNQTLLKWYSLKSRYFISLHEMKNFHFTKGNEMRNQQMKRNE